MCCSGSRLVPSQYTLCTGLFSQCGCRHRRPRARAGCRRGQRVPAQTRTSFIRHVPCGEFRICVRSDVPSTSREVNGPQHVDLPSLRAAHSESYSRVGQRGRSVARKRYPARQIMGLLRAAGVKPGKGRKVPEVCKALGSTRSRTTNGVASTAGLRSISPRGSRS